MAAHESGDQPTSKVGCVLFLGPPGSGKGTQARRMSNRFGLLAMSSGDILRAEIKADSAIGRQASNAVQGGQLVSDDVVTKVMIAGIDRIGPDAGFILDGFPRTVPQAESLGQYLTAQRRGVGLVIDFRMGDATIVERIGQRRVCSNCKTTYNMRFFPPKVAGKCDECDGALVQRVDDREDVIMTRLETYRRQTAPLVEYYEQRELLRWVDASADAARVEAQVAELINELDATP